MPPVPERAIASAEAEVGHRKYVEQMRPAMKAAWARPEVRAKMCEAMKETWKSPELRRKRSETQRKILGKPEVRRNMSEAAKFAHARPEVKRKHSEARERPEFKHRVSELLKHSSRAIGHRARLRGAARPNGSERRLHSWLTEAGTAYVTEHKVGPYLADVFVQNLGLVIECDGYYHTTERGIEKDRARDLYMRSFGLTVLRFDSCDIDSGKARPALLEALSKGRP